MTHRLDVLLRPRSIAIIGASARKSTLGNHVIQNVIDCAYPGDVYPVNPGYEELLGLHCFPSIDALPEVPQLAIFCVSDERIERALDEAIAAGVPAVSIMSTLYLDGDSEPQLLERIRRKIEQSGVIACGANGMGFYNVSDRLWACGFDSRHHEPPGNVAFISHSGSGMCGIADCDQRIRFNLAVSTGNELGVTMDEYLDFALDLPDTRVVGLFIETARNPSGLRAALQKANDRKIPVIAIKVGRTSKAAEMAVSHSGAIAGDDAAYDALFDRYGVQRVADMEEMAVALILFSTMHPVGAGGLVALHDSGGERQLLIDLADSSGVPLTEISADTAEKLREALDPELPAVNPLDGWSRGGPDADRNMTRCLTYLMQDAGAALGALMLDRAPDGRIFDVYMDYMRTARQASGKPVALVSAWQGSGSDPLAVSATHAGMPVVDGVSPFLRGVRAMLDYRDFSQRGTDRPAQQSNSMTKRWQERLRGNVLHEAEALALLRDFGVDASPCITVSTHSEAVDAARELGWPVAVKTGARIAHKTERDGVHLAIGTEEALVNCVDDLQARLGPEILVAPMARPGVEMILGARKDPQFGPVIILGFGGVHAEILCDVQFALPPFDQTHALRMLDRLKLRALLDGARGAPAVDIGRLAQMASRFSILVHTLQNAIREVDVNPVIASADGCVAVDALIIGT